MILATFVVFMAMFFLVGIGSVLRSRGTKLDYYLASRGVSPMFAGLSAVATNNSGYMFIGVIGYTYVAGLAAVWLMLGWILGDLLASLFVHRRLRRAAGASGQSSYIAVLAGWQRRDLFLWQRLAAIVSLVFLGTYAAAQISAGSKALHGVLGWPVEAGAVLSAAMVLLYSAAGGIRASIWTDVAQSMTMLVAMSILFVAGVQGQHGLMAAIDRLHAIPGYLDLTPQDLLVPGVTGYFLFVVGWMFAGLSVVGQPHVMVRFMSLESESQMTRARGWYYIYFLLFYLLATAVGLLSRLYLPELESLDPELALPSMAVELLDPFLVGVILAGIFAATMSTADSLVLSCSSAITSDLLEGRLERPLHLKLVTALVTLVALGLALSGEQSVFDLVILSWSTLACAFAPLLVLYALRCHVDQGVALATTLVAIAIGWWWRWMGWQDALYEGLPGICGGALVGWLLSRWRWKRSAEASGIAPDPRTRAL
ncbi:MAG: sodium/proline symporter [Pseudomonadales bacterium]